MIIVIAPDKFKGSLSAEQVCQAIAEGLDSVNTSWEIMCVPLADGGDGTAELLTKASQGKILMARVLDPLFREIEASYGISADGKTAFIEMAKASGLGLLKTGERNPLNTSTFGTGQLIADAMNHGVEHIVLGIGGSATNDAGIGMAEALGFVFLDSENRKLKSIGKNLVHLKSIDTSKTHPLLSKVKFTVLCDVNNPLFGEQGAAYVFGPQKGADLLSIKLLDSGLQQFANVTESSFSVPVNFPGAGASGGLGAGASVFLHAGVSGGFDFISAFVKLEEHIRQADWVITGEGKMDSQSLSGKVVGGVAKLALQNKKRCIAFTGIRELSPKQTQQLGIEKVVSLVNPQTTEREAIKNAYEILKKRTVEAFS